MNRLLAFFALSLSFFPALAADNPKLQFNTSAGSFVVELPEKAPKTVENFMKYVNDGFYQGTIFHRVINVFVVQGGLFTPDFQAKATYPPIVNEANNGLLNEPGTLAMARLDKEPDSATSQFFINMESNKHLNHYKPEPDYMGHTVFGRVTKGMEVVQKIAAVQTGAGGPYPEDAPQTPILIESVSTYLEPEPAPAPVVTKAPVKSKAKKKAPAKKSTAKKTPAKKTATSKSTSQKSTPSKKPAQEKK